MSPPRFTPEFKDEAVRQITEQSYSVAKVSARLGVSAHSLYKWSNAVRPDKTDQQASELLAAKSEILSVTYMRPVAASTVRRACLPIYEKLARHAASIA